MTGASQRASRAVTRERQNSNKQYSAYQVMLVFAAHTSYQKRFNKVLSFVVMGAPDNFLHLTNDVYEIMSVCMCVKQQTDGF